MHIYRCRLELHDTLFYATREMGTLYETERYLHNYALSYALFNNQYIRRPYHIASSRPSYAEDLSILNEQGIYVTPAHPLHWSFLLVTWKMAQVSYHRASLRFGDRGNFPENYGRAKELAPESEFEFFIFSREALTLPRWIRLGKRESKALVLAEPVKIIEHAAASYVSAIALNPLDIPGDVMAYDLISMPPVSLIQNAHLYGQHYEFPDGLRLPAEMHYTFR